MTSQTETTRPGAQKCLQNNNYHNTNTKQQQKQRSITILIRTDLHSVQYSSTTQSSELLRKYLN